MPLDQERERIQDDLRGLVEGEVRCDDISVQMYASDASLYEIRPFGVVRPSTSADIVAVVNYARENRIPVHPRGAGTGLNGGCLGTGIIVDTSRYMRRVLEIDGDLVKVQPGVVLAQLNEQLRPYSRHYGVDPFSSSVTTMGSVIAVDAKGSRWLRYGSPRRHVRSLRVVLASGDEVTLMRKHVVNGKGSDGSPLGRIERQVHQLLTSQAKAIEDSKCGALVNSHAYHLDGIATNDSVDLAGLMIGSEGTLGFVSEATLETHGVPPKTGVLLLYFDRLEKAARAALELRKYKISACDLMDRRLLTLARESDVRYDILVPRAAEATLLVECEDEDASQLGQRLADLSQLIVSRKKLAIASRTAIEPSDTAIYWNLAKRVVPSLYRLQGGKQALPFVDDIAVPPDALPSFLLTAQTILQRHAITASFFAHAAHGQVQMRPFLDARNPDDILRLNQLASELFEVVFHLNGTISAQQGDGLSRSWYLRKHAGPAFQLYREIKSIFDPTSLFNPTKVADSRLQRPTSNIRSFGNSFANQVKSDEGIDSQERGDPDSGTRLRVDPVPLMLNWADSDIENVVRACNGCGECKTQDSMLRMCPIFRFSPTEEASPRAKVNLMRGLLNGQLSQDELVGEELKNVADLCVHCYQCREECPAGVAVHKLMVESKAQYVASNGLKFADWMLTRLDLVAAFAIRFHRLANFYIKSPRMRWMVEKTIGIARRRKLPTFDSRSFMSVAAKRRLIKPSNGSGAKVMYFADLYANWFDIELAECMIDVFQHNGISIFVDPRQIQSGMSLMALGAVERARRIARRNVLVLANAVRQGYQIVTTEPSAALCISQEYPNLVDDEDARIVAENTTDACHYLWRLHQQGKLELDFNPLTAMVGYHLPCHVRAMGEGAPGESLLNLIPGLTVKRLEKGCSGMAGTFGLHRKNFRNSLRAGWPLIKAMRDPSIPFGTTECSACKIQMEQGTSKPTIHPLKLLAYAYGLRPEIAERMRESSGTLTIT